MTVRKVLCALVGLSISAVATAAEEGAVSATKASTQPEVIAKAYASLALRHSTLEKLAADGSTNIIPSVIAIPTLGTHLLDDKLDVALTWAFQKKPDSIRLTKLTPYAEVTYTVLDSAHATLFPYVYVEQNDGASFGVVDVGPHLDLKADLMTPLGKLALSGFVEPLAEFTSGKSATKAPVRDRTTRSTDLTLRDDGTKDEPKVETEIEQRHPSIFSTTELAAKQSIDAVKGLAVSVGIDYFQNWIPHYQASTVDDSTRYDLDGYSVKSAVMNKVGVSYKLSEKLSIANQVRYMVNGLYRDSYDTTKGVTGISSRVENRLTLTATLF